MNIAQYTKERGRLMWNLNLSSHGHVTNNKDITPQLNMELPFEVATDNDELEVAIRSFNVEQYVAQVNRFSSVIGLVFDGQASRHLADIIECYI